MSLLRRVIGAVLRRLRLRQGRTLRDVAAVAGVSVPYLSEVERGRKEASSEVLASICRALGIHLADLLELARDELLREARRSRLPRSGSAVSGSAAGRIASVVGACGATLKRPVHRAGSAHRRCGGSYEYTRDAGAGGRRVIRRPGVRAVVAGTDHLSRYGGQ